MNIADFKEMLLHHGAGSEYERMLVENVLHRVAPEDQLALDDLAGVLIMKGTRAVREAIELAEKAVTGGSRVRSEHLRAAITHAYPAEGLQILNSSMRRG